MGNGNVWIRPSTGVLWCISIALCISITILFMIVLESYKKGDKTVIQMLEDEDLNELVQKTRKKNISSKEMKDATNQLLSYLLGEEYTKEDLGPTMDFLIKTQTQFSTKAVAKFFNVGESTIRRSKIAILEGREVGKKGRPSTLDEKQLESLLEEIKEAIRKDQSPTDAEVIDMVFKRYSVTVTQSWTREFRRNDFNQYSPDPLLCTPQRPSNYQQSASFTPIPLASIAPQYASSTLTIPTQTMGHLQNNSLSNVRGSRLPTKTQENAPMPSIESMLEAPYYTKVSSSTIGSMSETPPFKRSRQDTPLLPQKPFNGVTFNAFPQ